LKVNVSFTVTLLGLRVMFIALWRTSGD